MADRQSQVLPGVPDGYRHTPRRDCANCPFMICHVSLCQARPLFAVPGVDILVRGQMSAVQRGVLFDMAVFDSRVL